MSHAADVKQHSAMAGVGSVVTRRFRVLFPLPDVGFDTTECAVAWHTLTEAGHECVFATEGGVTRGPPQCDPKLLTGVIFGLLGAETEAIAGDKGRTADPLDRNPMSWRELEDTKVLESFDGLWS